MRFLLTSAGIKNTSIHDALVDLLGKPIAESNALCIPTAMYAMPGGAGMAWRLINGREATPQEMGVFGCSSVRGVCNADIRLRR
jgi:dipeptidase E